MKDDKTCCSVVLLALLLTGCGKSGDSTPKPQPQVPAKKASVSANPTEAAPDNNAGTPPPAAAPAPPGTVAPAPGTPGTVGPNGTVVNGLVVVRNSNGETLEAEKVIYKAIEIYVEGKGKPYPKSLDEVVQSGVIAELPAAPDGKKWALQGNKVVLLGN